MKKYVFIGCAFLLATLSLFCVNTQDQAIGGTWKLESISDTDKKVPCDRGDMILTFDRNNAFKLSDRTNGKEWVGTYTLKNVDNVFKDYDTYELAFTCKNKTATLSGVLGTRRYEDNTKDFSITLTMGDKILSFVSA